MLRSFKVQGFKVQGFVNITLENKDSGQKKVFKYNNLTKLGEQLFLATSSALRLSAPNGIHRGQYMTQSRLGKTGGGRINYEAFDFGVHTYLIDHPSTIVNTEKLLPLYGANMALDNAKLIGFGCQRKTPASAKEGIAVAQGDTYFAEDNTVTNKLFFDTTQANGTFNKVCIGSGILSDRGNGVSTWKFLENVDIALGETTVGHYARPGIAGVTSADEILLGEGSGKVARKVLNLVTGVETGLEAADPRYDLQLGDPDFPQVVVGGFWFRWASNNVWRYDIAGGVESGFVGASVSLYKTLFTDGSFIYWSTGSQLNKYGIDPFTFDSQIDMSTIALPDILPEATFTTTNTIAELDGNYYIGSKTNDTTIVCTDFLNPSTTLVGIQPETKFGGRYNLGSDIIILSIAGDVINDCDIGYYYVPTTTGFAGMFVNTGLKMCKQSGNMISFVNLSSPVTKTSADTMTVEYGYRLV